MDPEQYPKTDVGDHQEEQIIRDFSMFNYHINSHKMRWLKNVIDVIDAHRFVDDFCHEIDTTNIWAVNRDGGAGTYDCEDEVNGVLKLCPVADDLRNYVEITQMNKCWKLVNCYPLYTEARIKISSITNSVFWFGLLDADSWLNDTHPSDYVAFFSPSGNANIEFLSRSLEAAYAGYGPFIDTGIDYEAGEWIRLGLHWDGAGTIRWFVIEDGNEPQTILATGTRTTYIPQTVELTVGFGIQTYDASAKCMSIDYLKCAQLRVIE